ncbi:MAG: hypothetical protein K6E70_01115 [Butyrivibrio sp.]|nr:hypothetical protein [Butyrivibrio sp.]
MDKLKALSKTIQQNSFYEFTDLDEVSKLYLIQNHKTNSNLFAVMMDYIDALENQIEILRDLNKKTLDE